MNPRLYFLRIYISGVSSYFEDNMYITRNKKFCCLFAFNNLSYKFLHYLILLDVSIIFVLSEFIQIYYLMYYLIKNFFLQSQTNLDNAELFVNCLEAMVETCLPIEDGELHDLSQYPSTLSVSSTMNLSSSMSSLTLGSPTEKEPTVEYSSLVNEGSARMRHGSSSQLTRQRSLKCKNSKNGKNSH